MEEHRLRWMVKDWMIEDLSESISDAELDEFESIMGTELDEFMDDDIYQYNSHFILTKNLITRDTAVEKMCCGIITKDVQLSNNEFLYFAFDYGH